MPIAFFSRTQTGALISRLNNDVIGAQQAFTDLFSNVVGNVVLVAIILVVMFILSWQITLVALVLVPVFLIPARRVGRRLGTLFQRGMELNAEMNMVMTERFNVAGAMLVKLFGRPNEERENFEQSRRPGARHRHPPGDLSALLLHHALADRVARDGLRLRLRRRRGGRTASSMVGTVVALTRISRSTLRPADATVEPQHRLHVGHGQLRAALRGARPRAHDQREPQRRRRFLPGRPSCASTTSTSRIPAPRTSHLASLEAVARLDDTPRTAVLHDVSFDVEPGTMTALVGPQRRRQDDDLDAGLAPLRRRRGLGHHQRRRRARRDDGVTERDGRRRHPRPAPLS